MRKIVWPALVRAGNQQFGLIHVVVVMIDGSDLMNSHEGLLAGEAAIAEFRSPVNGCSLVTDVTWGILEQIRNSPTVPLPRVTVDGVPLSRRSWIRCLNAIRDAVKIEPQAPAEEAPPTNVEPSAEEVDPPPETED